MCKIGIFWSILLQVGPVESLRSSLLVYCSNLAIKLRYNCDISIFISKIKVILKVIEIRTANNVSTRIVGGQ